MKSSIHRGFAVALALVLAAASSFAQALPGDQRPGYRASLTRAGPASAWAERTSSRNWAR